MAFTDRSPITMQGKILIAERQFNGADLEGLDYIGNADDMSLTIKQKEDEIEDNFSGRGGLVASPVVSTMMELKIRSLDLAAANWARSVWGSWGGAQVAGSVASESVVLYNGRYVQLAKTNVSNVVVAGAVADTDYVVDSAPHGRLRVLTTSSAAPDGTPLTTTVAYDYAANNGLIEAFVQPQKFYRVVLDGINVAQGNQPIVIRVHQWQMSMTDKLDLIGKKHIELTMTGKLLIDDSISDDGEFSQYFTVLKG